MEVVGEEVSNIGPDFQGVAYTLLLLGCGVHSAIRGCIQRKTWCMEPYAGVDYNSHYLIVNSEVSYPSPIQREMDWGRSLLMAENTCICLLISKTVFFM
jgi:hypothetical protein